MSDIIQKAFENIPIESKLKVAFQMHDYENWKNGDYFGDAEKYVEIAMDIFLANGESKANESSLATKLVPGCTVYMNSNSGCIGYGNIQCVSGVCEPLGEVSLYGHNQNYNIHDIKEIVSFPN